MALAPTPDPIYIFKGPMDAVFCITTYTTETCERIYAGTQGGYVFIWNMQDKRVHSMFHASDFPVLSLTINHEDKTLITFTKNGELAFWGLEGGEENPRRIMAIEYIGFCRAELFENCVYVSKRFTKCEIIPLRPNQQTRDIDLGPRSLGDLMAIKVVYIRGILHMIVSFESGKMALWDLVATKEISNISTGKAVLDMDFDPSRDLCVGVTGKAVILVSVAKRKLVLDRKTMPIPPGTPCVRIRPDKKLIAVGCADGKIRLFSWPKIKLLVVLETHTSSVLGVDFTENYKEDGRLKYLLAAGSKDYKISLWDLYN